MTRRAAASRGSPPAASQPPSRAACARRPSIHSSHLSRQSSQSFAAAVRGERPAELATARDGVAVMAAIEAARRSAANGGGWEPLATAG